MECKHATKSDIIGRIACGVLSDRTGPLNSMIPMTTVAGILTMAWPYARTSNSLIIIAVFYGIASGAFGTHFMVTLSWWSCTNRKIAAGLLSLPVTAMGDIGDIGRRQGMLFSLLAVGAILGPPISGIINMATHGYVAVGFYAGTLDDSLGFPSSAHHLSGSVVLVGVVFMIVCRTMITGHIFWGKI